MEKYIPISCSYYDELEALATLRKECEIVFTDENGKQTSIRGIIKTFFIRDKTEYMQLESGVEIRLDFLISVDGKKLPDGNGDDRCT
jgi:Rho-binding antiterminator